MLFLTLVDGLSRKKLQRMNTPDSGNVIPNARVAGCSLGPIVESKTDCKIQTPQIDYLANLAVADTI